MSISSRIEYVPSNDLLEDPVPASRAPATGLGRRRQLAGLALALVSLPLLTLLLTSIDDSLSLEGEVLLYLLAVVIVAGGGGPGVGGGPGGGAPPLLYNFFFSPPPPPPRGPPGPTAPLPPFALGGGGGWGAGG